MTSCKNYNQIKHLAFIMDGNRRWAKSKHLPIIAGHKQGVDSLKRLTKFCLEHGIRNLTAYAFSTENWKRKESELEFLFKLLAEVALRELDELKKLGVKVNFLGDITKFQNFNIQDNLYKLANETQFNTKMQLNLALNYGSISELTNAINQIKNTEELDEQSFKSFLYTSSIPDPEILIRTGGEKRLSNFLLWQCANSDLIFTNTLWPDFNENELKQILNDYLSKTKILEVLSA